MYEKNLKNQYKEAQTTFAQAMLTENNAAEPTTKSSPNIHNPNPHARKSYSMFNTAIVSAIYCVSQISLLICQF